MSLEDFSLCSNIRLQCCYSPTTCNSQFLCILRENLALHIRDPKIQFLKQNDLHQNSLKIICTNFLYLESLQSSNKYLQWKLFETNWKGPELLLAKSGCSQYQIFALNKPFAVTDCSKKFVLSEYCIDFFSKLWKWL